MRALLLAAATVVAGAAAGCGNGGGTPAAPDAAYDCSVETRADHFAVGMAKPGSQGTLTFKLMSSTPAPPSRGDNTWQIDVVDAGGSPVAGAAMVVTPFMPDHNHGTQIKAVITEPSPGHYEAKPVNLWMPGLWQVTIIATPPGKPADRAVFSFCIPG
jgi:YtkA-like